MDYKSFSLCSRDYRFYESGVLTVFTKSKNDWVVVSPKKYTALGVEGYRYSLWEPNYDWAEENKKAITRYNENSSHYISMDDNTIVSSSIYSISAPVAPSLMPKGKWRRFFITHGALVMKYWYGMDMKGKKPKFTPVVPDNIFHVSNYSFTMRNEFFVRVDHSISEGIVNTVLANCGSYSSSYIAKALDIGRSTVQYIILGTGTFKGRGNRSEYILNLRSARGCFYEMICHKWELDIDFINRMLIAWSPDCMYAAYLDSGVKKDNVDKYAKKLTFNDWYGTYGRSSEGVKALLLKWVDLNSDCINNVEELKEHILNFDSGSGKYWTLERYYEYMKNNMSRMPKRVRLRKGYPCNLRVVGIDKSTADASTTLYSLSDWQLLNLFDYTGGDFQSYRVEDMLRFVYMELEDAPVWDSYASHGYESVDEFKAGYYSMLGGITIHEFREAYKDTLMGIPL